MPDKNDSTKSNSLLDVHTFQLKALNANVSDLTKVVHDSIKESTKNHERVTTRLDEHIVSCNKTSRDLKNSLDSAITAINMALGQGTYKPHPSMLGVHSIQVDEKSPHRGTALIAKMPWYWKTIITEVLRYGILLLIFLVVVGIKHTSMNDIPKPDIVSPTGP